MKAFFHQASDSIVSLCTDWWLVELASWTLGALCICAIGGFVALYDGQPLPETSSFGLTFNAYIAVIGAIAKIALAVPLEEALGAQKYLWFSTKTYERPLMDFEKFDDAPRGPVGALRLIWRTKARSMGSMAGIIMLLSLGLDPFFQQLVSFPKSESLNTRSRIAKVVAFTGARAQQSNNTGSIAHDNLIPNSLGTFLIESSSLSNISGFCAAEECTWPEFDTLGVCSECVDIGDMLDFGCHAEPGVWRTEFGLDTNFTQPSYPDHASCGYFLNSSSEKPMLMSGYSIGQDGKRPGNGDALIMNILNLRHPLTNELFWNGAYRLAHIPTPIANIMLVGSNNLEAVYANKTPQAFECAMRWCSKTLSSSFTEGLLSERILSTWTNDTEIPQPLTVELTANKGFEYTYSTNVSIMPPGKSETFRVDNNTMLSTRWAVENYFPGYLTQTNDTTLPFFRFRNGYSRKEGGSITDVTNATAWLSTRAVPDVFDDMATAITNGLRMNKRYQEIVLGSGVFETFVKVQWAWFSFPLVVMVGTLIFLFVTMWQTSGSPIWKSSSLTVLAHGLSWDAKYEFKDIRKMRQIREKAEEMMVRLDMTKESGVLDIEPTDYKHGTWDEKFIKRYHVR